MKKVLAAVSVITILQACGDDDNGGVQLTPPRLLAEVVLENDAEIQEFLDTHFYNYEDFQEPVAPDFDFKIVIDTIAGENLDKVPLAEQVSSATIEVSSTDLGIDTGEENIPHTYYYLEVREGQGVRPTVGDSVLTKFEGSLLNGAVFDAVSDFTWELLPAEPRGYANTIAQTNSGTRENIVINPDGTTEITDSGIGLMVIPSGLGFFNSPRTPLIPLYAPLVFTFENGLTIENTDSDGDGIPNIQEDLNDNNFLFDDNTDAQFEEENFILPAPNFLDIDDDGDGIPTAEEIIIDENGNITFPDTDGDGIPDYLDPDS